MIGLITAGDFNLVGSLNINQVERWWRMMRICSRCDFGQNIGTRFGDSMYRQSHSSMGRNQIEICFGRMNSKGGGRTEYCQRFIPGRRCVHRREKTRSTHHGGDTGREANGWTNPYQRRSNMDRAAKELWLCLLNESLDNLYG